ncbi:MAG: hypothetical protein IPK69_01785 [Phycisphaerales bacterium]|nr:MAG: hypothetical protein IPK69_01785 [Phycisphaerales bacterium]
MAGLVSMASAQSAVYPRVNFTGWPQNPGAGGYPCNPNYYTDFFPNETRMGVVVQFKVYYSTPTDAADNIFCQMKAYSQHGLLGPDPDGSGPLTGGCTVWIQDFLEGTSAVFVDEDMVSNEALDNDVPPNGPDWPDTSPPSGTNLPDFLHSFQVRQPWMTKGRQLAKAWMEDFAERLRQQIENNNQTLGLPDLPFPDRFHFDWENTITGSSGSTNEPFMLRAMSREPARLMPDGQTRVRWDTEPVPGYNGLTMSQLWLQAVNDYGDVNDANNPFFGAKPDPIDNYSNLGDGIGGGWQTRPLGNSRNQALAVWFFEVCHNAKAAVLKECAYDPLKQWFPEAKCDNYFMLDVSEALQFYPGWWHNKETIADSCQWANYPGNPLFYQDQYKRYWWGALTDVGQHGWRLPSVAGRGYAPGAPSFSRWLALTNLKSSADFASPVLWAVGQDNETALGGQGHCHPGDTNPECDDGGSGGSHCNYTQGIPYFRPGIETGSGLRYYKAYEDWWEASDRVHRSWFETIIGTNMQDINRRTHPQDFIVPWTPSVNLSQIYGPSGGPLTTGFYPDPESLHATLALYRSKQIPEMTVFTSETNNQLRAEQAAGWRDVYQRVYTPYMTWWGIEWGADGSPVPKSTADPEGEIVSLERLTDTNPRFVSPLTDHVRINAEQVADDPCVPGDPCREWKASIVTDWFNVGIDDPTNGFSIPDDEDLLRINIEAEALRLGIDAEQSLVTEVPNVSNADPVDFSVRCRMELFDFDQELWRPVKFGDFYYESGNPAQYGFWAPIWPDVGTLPDPDTLLEKKSIMSRRTFYLRTEDVAESTRWSPFITSSGMMHVKIVFESSKVFSVDLDLVQVHAMRDPRLPPAIPNGGWAPPPQLDPVDDPHYAFIGEEPKALADLDYNNEVNVNDFGVFMEKYGEENVLADINMDGVVDMQDVVEFTNGYAGGGGYGGGEPGVAPRTGGGDL